jgi:hypothetical protein
MLAEDGKIFDAGALQVAGTALDISHLYNLGSTYGVGSAKFIDQLALSWPTELGAWGATAVD